MQAAPARAATTDGDQSPKEGGSVAWGGGTTTVVAEKGLNAACEAASPSRVAFAAGWPGSFPATAVFTAGLVPRAAG